MRVIAGKAKSRNLHDVPGPGTRPITNRAKAALFSIIGPDVADARFLDLFAGTGQVGIEALSRGAAAATFVEKGSAALRTIHANLALTGLEAGTKVVSADVFQYLLGVPEPFDYIYIAPPQYRGLWRQALQMVDLHPEWLNEDGWVIVQIHPVEYESVELRTFELFDQREYGSVMLCFYQRRLDDDDSGDVG
jgi:16S rRNA (guanine(966)-N(2))-methyltransferase RsmD